MKSIAARLTIGLLMGLVLAVAAMNCFDPEEFRGTYQEARTIEQDREYAYRLSLFRFGDEVGGVIRFFEIGEYLNTRDNPYFLETFCDYFGPVFISQDSFRFSVDDGPDNQAYVFQFESLDSSTIHTDLNILRPTAESTEVTQLQFELERVPLAVDRDCRQRADYTKATASVKVLQIPPTGTTLREGVNV